MASILYFMFLLYIGVQATSSSSATVGSLSIVRDVTDAAIDLDSSNFESVLEQSSTPFAIIEFYANWCPACRNYKPQYEKVARMFNGPDAVHPGVVLMAKVDCAVKINTKLCERFSINHYPMLLWGHSSTLASGSWTPKHDESEILEVDDFRQAERLLNWINKQLGRYTMEDKLEARGVDRATS